MNKDAATNAWATVRYVMHPASNERRRNNVAQRAPKWTHNETTVVDAIETGKSELESLRDEYQEWFDNLPESFQNGQKGEELQSAIDTLEEAIEKLDTAVGTLSNNKDLESRKIVVSTPQRAKSTWVSRAMRGNDAQLYIETAKNEVEAVRDEHEDDKPASDSVATATQDDFDYEQLIEELEEANDTVNNVEWVTQR